MAVEELEASLYNKETLVLAVCISIIVGVPEPQPRPAAC